MKKQNFAFRLVGIFLLSSCGTLFGEESSFKIESSSSEMFSSLPHVSSGEIVNSQINTSSKDLYEFTYPTKSLTEYLNVPPTEATYTNQIYEKYDSVTDIETYEENGTLYDQYGSWIPKNCIINGVFSYNVKVEYPIFSRLENKEVETKLNQWVEESVEIKDKWVESGNYYYEMSYEVHCLNSKFVSVIFSIQTEGVGLNFQWYGYSILLDLETGERLHIGDFLELSENSLKKIIDDRNTEYVKDSASNYYDNMMDFRKEILNFCDKGSGDVMYCCSGFSPEDGGKIYVFLKMSGNFGKGVIFEVSLSELEGYYY